MLDVQRLSTETSLAHVEHHASLPSTNDRAKERSAENPPLPMLIVADEQTAGRGREDRSWWTGRGNLAMTLLIDPAEFGLPQQLLPRVSLATGVAVVETVRPLIPGHIELGLHWPNDVFAAGHKLAGILVEGPGDGRLVIGIGLNANADLEDAPPDVQRTAISLRSLTGQTHNRTELLVRLINHLGAGLDQFARDPDGYGHHFQRLNLQRGHHLKIRHGKEVVSGRCEAIATDGALVLSTTTGAQRIYSGSTVREFLLAKPGPKDPPRRGCSDPLDPDELSIKHC